MSRRFLLGTRKGLFTWERTESGWSAADVSFLADPVTAVLADPRDGAWYAALNLGHYGAKLHRSRDEGRSWEECEAPVFPEKPAEAESLDPPDKNPWSLQLIWCLEAGGAEEAGRLWAGTIPGGLFRSDDHGSGWELVRSLWDRAERREWFGGGYDQPGIHSICVDPRNPLEVTLGISIGGVWHTPDGGESWELRGEGMEADYMPPEQRREARFQDPHLLTRCAAHPDTMWVQHHNGVFRSDDAGRTFVRILGVVPSDFGFAMGVHPRDPRTAWTVPAVKDECRVPVDGKLVVSRTRDGGESFEALSEGLPERHCYDLIYRHAFAVAPDGDHLVMGSTTGSLWISSDQGESWQALSHHMPPVYCVRFLPE